MGFIGGGGVPGNDSFTKILLHMDGSNGATSFPDVAVGSAPHTWTAIGAAAVDATAGKFSSGALKGPYITTPHIADFNLGSGAFTIDFWLNLSGQSGAFYTLGDVDASGAVFSHYMQINSNGTGTVNVNLASGGGGYALSTGTNFFATGLTHVAIVRASNSTLQLYVNGSLESQRFDLSGAAATSTGSYSIGRRGDYTLFPMPAGAIIDEYRLSVGIARWTSNFTPPTAQYI